MGHSMNRKKCKKFIKLSVLNIFFIVICMLGMIPIFYALYLSLSGSGGALSAGFRLIPKDITLENYRKILEESSFLSWFSNSVILSVSTVIVALGLSISSAYAFSRYRFKGRNGVLKMLIMLNAFPQILSMFAIFRLFKEMNLLDKKLGLVIIYAGTMCIFSIWNLKGYFDTIPLEIEEASKIDGANDFQMLAKIIFPLAMPAIIVTSVMILIFVWNEYIFSTTFMLNESNYTLAGGLYQLQSNDYSRSWPLFSAAAMITSLPILIIFFCIQKYMVSGLTAGGVKG